MASPKKLFQREILNGVSIEFQRREQVTRPLINRLGLEKELEGHGGCVNCLEWNSDGSLLASGSDDLHVMLWNPLKHKTVSRVRTGHQGNIFSVKFLPQSNDSLLVSGAADHRVNVHDLTQGETTHVFNYHLGRVKRIATAPTIPCIFWSAAEDGTIMQFDLRCSSTTTTSPNNILINLNTHVGATSFAEIKCLAINPVRPEMLAVGANDPYVRVFDRRMLSCTSMRTPTNSRNWSNQENVDGETNTLPPGCAQYYIAGHLPQKQSDYKKRYRTLASTYVTFNPDGSELLVNLGGEQIYLYNINSKFPLNRFDLSVLDSTTAGSRESSSHTKNGFSHSSGNPANGTNGVNRMANGSGSFQVPTNQYEAGDHVMSSPVKSTTSSVRSRPQTDTKLSPMAEQWKKHANVWFGKEEYKRAIDAYNEAISHSSHSAVLYANRAAAYLKRKWDGDQYAALRDCYHALTLDPRHMKAHFRLARCLYELAWHQQAFECLKSFKQLYPDYSKSPACDTLDKDIRAAIFSQTEDKKNGSENKMESEQEEIWQKNASDYSLRFCGHCNTTTDIKEANFFGSNGQYIVAGSDDGSFFIWDKATTNIVRVLRGDESIVNCLQPHPSGCLLATSGIDPVVKLWSPRPQDGTENEREVNNSDDAAVANQKRMNADPLEVMLMNMGYRISGYLDDDEEGGAGEGGVGGDGPAGCRTT